MSATCTCGNYPHTFGCVTEDDMNEAHVADTMPQGRPGSPYPWGNYPCPHGDPCCCSEDQDEGWTFEDYQRDAARQGKVACPGCCDYLNSANDIPGCKTCKEIALEAGRRAEERACAEDAHSAWLDEMRAKGVDVTYSAPYDDMDDLADPFAE